MLKVEEKQYHEASRIETKSPMRGQIVHREFDNNLDYLLEDLQNSVRPEPITDNRHNSLNRITSLRPSNPITEYSSDDSYTRVPLDGAKNVKTVKKEVYSYQTSSGTVPHESNRARNNINELDSLLDDLQQVRQTPERYKSDEGQNYREYNRSKVITGKTVVDNVYPKTQVTRKTYVSSNATGEESLADNQYLNEGTYGNIITRTSATPPPIKTGTLSKQTKISNVQSYPIEVIETITPEMNSEILANLDPNLLPSGNTKVTTTIKTYTYEIPGTVYPSPNASIESDKYIYSPNESQTTPSKSFIYNKYEANTSSQNVNYTSDLHQRSIDNIPSIKRQPSPSITDEKTVTKDMVTSKNYQQGDVYPDGYGWEAHLYKGSTRTTGTNTMPYDRPIQLPPSSGEKTIVQETITSRNYQPGPGPTYTDTLGKQTYVYNESTLNRTIGTNTDYPIYKESSSTEISVPRQPYPVAKPPHPHVYPPNEYIHSSTTENVTTSRETNYIDDSRNKPPMPQYNITYSEKYKTDISYDENKPLLQYPGRFPTDSNDSPPKKLDELMATIGDEPPNSPLNAGFNAHESELAHQKKVETLKLQQKEVEQKGEQKKIQRTKNVTGPPVYYPPGHEMFSSKSESGGGGWRAEGEMQRESGKYKYESESKSSSKTKAAVIPVCLPLCCGLPCTIL